MSYEVYIDIEHHLKHGDEPERSLSDASRWSSSGDPEDAERMRIVVNALRVMADEIDPDHWCSNCGEQRHRHHGYPDDLSRCFNRYGPIAVAAWWRTERQEDAQ